MIKEIRTRRSTRDYNGKPIDDDKILQLIESARLAPSGSNTQPWNFIIVKSDETKEKIAIIDGNQMWMKRAPVFIVCVADIRCRIEGEADIFLDEESSLFDLKRIIRDTAIAIEHILLEAESMGLASCWTGLFIQEDIRPILGIPEDKFVAGVVTIGYSDEKGEQAPRRPIESMIRYEHW